MSSHQPRVDPCVWVWSVGGGAGIPSAFELEIEASVLNQPMRPFQTQTAASGALGVRGRGGDVVYVDLRGVAAAGYEGDLAAVEVHPVVLLCVGDVFGHG